MPKYEDMISQSNVHVGWDALQGVKLRLIQAPMRLIVHFGDQILKVSRQIGD